MPGPYGENLLAARLRRAGLHLLCLALVALLQLLRLLLVALLYLLLPLRVRMRLELLVLPLLLLLELLAFFILLGVELLLLLLELLVGSLIPRRRKAGPLCGLYFTCVGGRAGTAGRNVALRLSCGGVAGCGGWRAVANRGCGGARLRRHVIPCGGLSLHDAAPAKFRGARSGGYGRLAVVHVFVELPVGAGGLHVLDLNGAWWNVPLTHGDLFFRPGACCNPTGTAVVADVGDGDVVDDRFVVDVGDVLNMIDVAVIEEGAMIPIATFVAETDIAEAVVDASIEANVRSPKAFMEEIETAVVPAPPAGSPEQAGLGN